VGGVTVGRELYLQLSNAPSDAIVFGLISLYLLEAALLAFSLLAVNPYDE
jgi:hypothetical protein